LVRLFIANTDLAWFNFLSEHQPLDEVNHWQPGGRLRFNALGPGELLVFRLKAPINRIAGYGIFAPSALLPINLAWSSFGLKNGHLDFPSFKDAIYRLIPGAGIPDSYEIRDSPWLQSQILCR
jgi:putative restriction endonuclease